jgi:hypothetical protein
MVARRRGRFSRLSAVYTGFLERSPTGRYRHPTTNGRPPTSTGMPHRDPVLVRADCLRRPTWSSRSDRCPQRPYVLFYYAAPEARRGSSTGGCELIRWDVIRVVQHGGAHEDLGVGLQDVDKEVATEVAEAI